MGEPGEAPVNPFDDDVPPPPPDYDLIHLEVGNDEDDQIEPGSVIRDELPPPPGAPSDAGGEPGAAEEPFASGQPGDEVEARVVVPLVADDSGADSDSDDPQAVALVDVHQASEARSQLIYQLRSMGFQQLHCQKAVETVDNPSAPDAADRCLTWMLQNPLTDEMKHSSLKSLVSQIAGMGFNKEQAERALRLNNYNVDASIDWLVSELSRQAEEEHTRVLRQNSLRRERAKREAAMFQLDVTFDNDDDEDPEGVCYGHLIALRCVAAPQPYMISYEKRDDLNADSDSVSEECVFKLLDPNDLANSGPIKAGGRVCLQCSDRCFAGVEANGSVYSNRRRPGALCHWRVLNHDDSSDRTQLKFGAHVRFVSSMQTLLHLEPDTGGCSALKKRDDASEEAAWSILYQRPVIDLPSTPMAFTIAHGAKSHEPDELWGLLRRNLRAAALLTLKNRIIEIHDEVDKEREILENQEAEEFTCIICWEEQPNTVLLECGHICVCSDCGPGLVGRDCPICRSPVEKVLEIRRGD